MGNFGLSTYVFIGIIIICLDWNWNKWNLENLPGYFEIRVKNPRAQYKERQSTIGYSFQYKRVVKVAVEEAIFTTSIKVTVNAKLFYYT